MTVRAAVLINKDTTTSVEVLFNPAEYSLTKDNTFAQAAVPGLGSPVIQFVNGNVRTLELELLFDSLEEHTRAGRLLNAAGSDVRDLLKPVLALLEINPETHAPPIMQFAWGADFTFTGVVTRAQQRFLMFRESGTPVRARLQLSMTEVKDPLEEAKEVKRQTADYSRIEQITQGDTLTGIAARRYGDPGRWRPIAIANGLDDPRRLPIGLPVTVPALPFRDPETSEVFR
jgi:Contractile injection system tube protein